MGGYSSTPRKGKVSEEGGDDTLYYAATGMQVSPPVQSKRITNPRGAGEVTSVVFESVPKYSSFQGLPDFRCGPQTTTCELGGWIELDRLSSYAKDWYNNLSQ